MYTILLAIGDIKIHNTWPKFIPQQDNNRVYTYEAPILTTFIEYKLRTDGELPSSVRGGVSLEE